MATRSYIGYEFTDGTIHAIYCHWDGYLNGVGRTLLKHYKETPKVLRLIELGDLSILGEEIGSKQNFNDPTEGTCLAYGRDRGEENTKAKLYDTLQDFKSSAIDNGAEWAYLFRGDRWFYWDLTQTYGTPLEGSVKLEVVR